MSIVYLKYFTIPLYQSSAKIIYNTNSSTSGSGFASQFGISLPFDKSNDEWNVQDVIKSRTLAKRLLKRKFKTKAYEQNQPLIKILNNLNKDENFDYSINEIRGIRILSSMINIKLNDTYYDLIVTTSEPMFASDLANAILEELESFQKEDKKKKSSNTRKFIESRIIETKKELEVSEEALKNFTDRNRRIENSPELQLQMQRLAREVSVLTGVFTTLKQQFETTKIEEVKDSDYVKILDYPDIPFYPSGPNKIRILFINTFIGILLPLVYIF